MFKLLVRAALADAGLLAPAYALQRAEDLHLLKAIDSCSDYSLPFM
jgi:hypothetical protein